MSTNKVLFKTRLREAEKFENNYLVDKLSDKLTAAASLFTRLQIRESKKEKWSSIYFGRKNAQPFVVQKKS